MNKYFPAIGKFPEA